MPNGRTALVITVSDRCHAGTQQDVSGPAVVRLLRAEGYEIVDALTLPDDLDRLTAALLQASRIAELIVTTGGTGLAVRDVTPEATLAACDRLVPGIPELLRREGTSETPYAVLSRGVCGTCGQALILNLPGSPAGAESSLKLALPLLPHALALLAGKTDHLVQ